MKIYNLNIDTSKPVNKVMQMQSNSTGLLKLNVTNDGKSIRNLTTKVYDGETEVPSTDNGFKIDMGKNEKVVKIEAKSTPIMSEWEDAILEHTNKDRNKTIAEKRLVLPAGTYKQEELLHLVDKVNGASEQWVCNAISGVETSNCFKIVFNSPSVTDPSKIIPIQFLKKEPVDTSYIFVEMNPDEDIVVTEGNYFFESFYAKCTSWTYSTTTYPAVGEYTDYQLDTTIKPSVNAPYDGDYTEPLTEVEVDGVKFVPTTLTIDGVDYKVLAEEQPEPTEPTTNDGE